MNNGHIAVLILLTAGAFHKVGSHQADLIAREHAEIFLGGLLHKVLPLNVYFPAEGHLTAAKVGILQIVGNLQLLHLSLRVVVNDQLDGVQHRHQAGLL